jgi:hypothetical protein
MIKETAQHVSIHVELSAVITIGDMNLLDKETA